MQEPAQSDGPSGALSLAIADPCLPLCPNIPSGGEAPSRLRADGAQRRDKRLAAQPPSFVAGTTRDAVTTWGAA